MFGSGSQTAADEAVRVLRPLRRDLLCLLRALVRVDSVNIPPDGNETAAQLVLKDFLISKGVAVDVYDTGFLSSCGHPYARTERNYVDRKNLAIRLPGSGRGKSLLLNGHIDTVPAGRSSWSASPWDGAVRGGKLYGLGSFDMKAGVAAQAFVAVALQSANIRLGGDLIFESVVDEEWGGGGGTLAARLKGDSADACVISEGTQLEILRATRGGFVVDLEVQAGDASAYFSKSEVVSPAVPMGRLLGWVDSWVGQRRSKKASGAYSSVADAVPVQVLAVEANRLDRDVPLSVPTAATVRVYLQFLPDEDPAAVLGQVRNSLDEFQSADSFFRDHPIHWKPLYDPPLLGHELSEEHPWTQCLASSALGVCRRPAVISAAPYPCDAFLMQREFGIPTLLFGPSGGGAHNPDEYVDLKSVIKTAEVLLTAALLWCGS